MPGSNDRKAAEKRLFEKIQSYLWRNGQEKPSEELAAEELSAKEQKKALDFIFSQAKHVSLSKRAEVQSRFITYSKAKLSATGIDALVSLQDNLIVLDDKKVKGLQPYRDILKNIVNYLMYSKLVLTEKEYNALMLKLRPVVEDLLLKTTALRMKHESEEEKKENIDLYNERHTASASEPISVYKMIHIYREKERIEDRRRKIIINFAIQKLEEFIKNKESELGIESPVHECTEIYESQDFSEAEESIVFARNILEQLKDSKISAKNKLFLIAPDKKYPDFPDELYNLLKSSSESCPAVSEDDIKLEVLHTEVEICLKRLERSGAASSSNTLHDKYRVVQKINSVINGNANDIDSKEVLDKVKVEALNSRYPISNNRESYRESFNENKQPKVSGIEILTERRHPILDKFISVIKEIFPFIGKQESVPSQSNNPSGFFNAPLRKVKTLKEMSTLSSFIDSNIHSKPKADSTNFSL